MQKRLHGMLLVFLAGCGAVDGFGEIASIPLPSISGDVDRERVSPLAAIQLRFDQPVVVEQLFAWLVPYERGDPCVHSAQCTRGRCYAGRCLVSRVDAAWLADAANYPLTASRSRHAVPLYRSSENTVEQLTLMAQTQLEPGGLASLVLSGVVHQQGRVSLALSSIEPQEFSVSGIAGAPPMAALLYPASQSIVPRNLAKMIVAFSKEIDLVGLIAWLESDTGEQVPVEVLEHEGCQYCAAIRPLSELGPNQHWQLRLYLGDTEVFQPSDQFILSSGELDVDAPSVQAVTVWGSDGCSHLELLCSEDGSVVYAIQGQSSEAFGGRLHRVGIEQADYYGYISWRCVDYAGNASADGSDAVWVRPRSVAISEILANPDGPDIPNEYVEIVNLSTDAVDLSGWQIQQGSKPAIPLPAETLAPGQRGLVVGPSFEWDADLLPAPGSLLITLQKNLSLLNSGATIALFDDQGRLISTAVGVSESGVAAASGFALHRKGACDVPASWVEMSPSPGGP